MSFAHESGRLTQDPAPQELNERTFPKAAEIYVQKFKVLFEQLVLMQRAANAISDFRKFNEGLAAFNKELAVIDADLMPIIDAGRALVDTSDTVQSMNAGMGGISSQSNEASVTSLATRRVANLFKQGMGKTVDELRKIQIRIPSILDSLNALRARRAVVVEGAKPLLSQVENLEWNYKFAKAHYDIALFDSKLALGGVERYLRKGTVQDQEKSTAQFKSIVKRKGGMLADIIIFDSEANPEGYDKLLALIDTEAKKPAPKKKNQIHSAR